MIKRPITILCISDLHLVKDSAGEKELEHFVAKLVSLSEEDIHWKPDYIAIAGDIVDCRDKNYANVQQHIGFITERFKIDKFRVVVVPGNHDKDFLDGDYKKENKKIKDFAKHIIGNQEKYDFVNAFSENFKSFSEFYSEYTNPTNNAFEYERGTINDEVAHTSGLKIFHDHKLCFLSVNTEWTYIPDKHRKKLKSVPVLCWPLVYSSIQKIRNSYPDYTVITLMHRDPSELTWVEKNTDYNNKPDVISDIYRFSDIILSGHNHIERMLPPDMMANSAQLFKLGSVSMESRSSNIVLYNATMLNVDPINNQVEVLALWFDKKYHAWRHEIEGIYRLVDRYPSFSKIPYCTNQVRTLYAKTRDKTDVDTAIYTAYKVDSQKCHLLYFSCYEVDEEMIRKSLADNKLTYLIVYHFNQEITKSNEVVNKLKERFAFNILKMELVIDQALVSVPIYATVR